MKRFGWAATALIVLSPTTAAGAPSPAASASPAPAGGVTETGDFITVKAPWDPAIEEKLNALLRQGEKALKDGKAKGDKATYEDTFLAWDAMCGDIDVIGSFASWDFNTSPDQSVRDRNEKTE